MTYSVTINGNTYSDNDNPSGPSDRNLGGQGNRLWFFPLMNDVLYLSNQTQSNANAATQLAASAALSYTNAAAKAVESANSANAAAVSAINAQGYASIAQAVSPDSPMRLNTKKISADFVVSEAYNAVSAGPIEIAENIIVTINDGATWSIV